MSSFLPQKYTLQKVDTQRNDRDYSSEVNKWYYEQIRIPSVDLEESLRILDCVKYLSKFFV